VEIRLRHLQEKMAIRILSMPETHPIRQRCPVTYPPFYETTREECHGFLGTSHPPRHDSRRDDD